MRRGQASETGSIRQCAPRRMLDRRHFLRGAAGAAIAGAPIGFLGMTSAAQAAQIDLHALGIQLYTLREPLSADFERTIAEVRRVGYEIVEHAGFHNRSATDFARMILAAGLRCTSGHVQVPSPFNSAAWQKALDDALTVGQTFIVSSGRQGSTGAKTTQDEWVAFAHDLNRAGEQARGHGLRFGYHNHHWEFARLADGRSRGYDVILAETDPNLVHMQLDVYWAWRGAQDPVDLFRSHPGRFLQMHVKDMSESGGFADVGGGLIDFARIFREAGQAGVVEFIVERDDAGRQAIETARSSYAYLKMLRF